MKRSLQSLWLNCLESIEYWILNSIEVFELFLFEYCPQLLLFVQHWLSQISECSHKSSRETNIGNIISYWLLCHKLSEQVQTNIFICSSLKSNKWHSIWISIDFKAFDDVSNTFLMHNLYQISTNHLTDPLQSIQLLHFSKGQGIVPYL